MFTFWYFSYRPNLQQWFWLVVGNEPNECQSSSSTNIWWVSAEELDDQSTALLFGGGGGGASWMFNNLGVRPSTWKGKGGHGQACTSSGELLITPVDSRCGEEEGGWWWWWCWEVRLHAGREHPTWARAWVMLATAHRCMHICCCSYWEPLLLTKCLWCVCVWSFFLFLRSFGGVYEHPLLNYKLCGHGFVGWTA